MVKPSPRVIRRRVEDGIVGWRDMLVETSVAGNELWRLAALFAVVLAAFALARIGRAILLAMARRFEGLARPMLPTLLRSLAASLALLSFSIGLKLATGLLVLAERFSDAAATLTSVVFVAAVGHLAYNMIDVVEVWLRRVLARLDPSTQEMLTPLFRKSLRVTVVILAVLQVATTLSDKPVTSLLAGLGIGGLAVALAAQDTIKNFFGSLVVFTDRPFAIGDRVVVDGHDGVVQEVGFRSTRIRTLEGNLVTLPNGELANKTILNIGQRPHIRRLMNVTITYDTPPEKVRRAAEILRDVLKDHEGMEKDFPPRVFFNDFNSASLNLLVIYWYHPPDYWKFMAFGEKVNLEILRRFNEEGIEFAFPTQTLYLAGDPRRPLSCAAKERGAHGRD